MSCDCRSPGFCKSPRKTMAWFERFSSRKSPFISATNVICRSCAKACTALASGAHSSGLVRRIGTGPVLPCCDPSKSPVVFQLAVVRKDTVPAPSCRAKRFPFGVIVRRATMGHHAHHRRTAAHDPRLSKADQRRVVLAPPVHLEVGPEIGVVVVRAWIGIEYVSGLAAGRRVAPGLQHQDTRCRPR